MDHSVRAGGLAWEVGADSSEDKRYRRVHVHGFDLRTTDQRIDLDAGAGNVRAVRAVAEQLWVVIARERFIFPTHSDGVEVIAVRADGSWRTVLEPDRFELPAAALRPRPGPDEFAAAVALVRRMFDETNHHYWHTQDGTTKPLAEGLSDGRVGVDHDWPDTAVVVTFRHTSRPGLLLRRTFRVFDESGAPQSWQYADMHLMEDIDCNFLPDADEAVDGVLDV